MPNDFFFLILILLSGLFATWASARVKSTFDKYSKEFSKRGITGEQACRQVLDAHNLQSVRIEKVQGQLTDHYSPRENVIRLSDSVFASTSSAAIGVACHEAGHAMQYADGYAPIKLRNAIIPITNIGSKLSMPLIIIGLLLASSNSFGINLAYFGVLLFSATALFQLLTLPTEFNASHRALKVITEYNILDDEEIEGAKNVLSAAALTYVAALAVALVQLLRLLSIVMRSRRRD